MTTSDVGAIVLCGGTSRRMGVADKTQLLVDGRPLLDHVLTELPAAWPVVCVGIPRATVRAVEWVREDPPLGGPVAGIDAGLTRVRTPHVVVIAGDEPRAATTAVLAATTLAEQPSDVDAVWTEPADRPPTRELGLAPSGGARPSLRGEGARPETSHEGQPGESDATQENPRGGDGRPRAQPLLAAYRTDRLRPLVAGRRDVGVYATLRPLRVHLLPAPSAELIDLDTPEDVRRYESGTRHHTRGRPARPATPGTAGSSEDLPRSATQSADLPAGHPPRDLG